MECGVWSVGVEWSVVCKGVVCERVVCEGMECAECVGVECGVWSVRGLSVECEV